MLKTVAVVIMPVEDFASLRPQPPQLQLLPDYDMLAEKEKDLLIGIWIFLSFFNQNVLVLDTWYVWCIPKSNLRIFSKKSLWIKYYETVFCWFFVLIMYSFERAKLGIYYSRHFLCASYYTWMWLFVVIVFLAFSPCGIFSFSAGFSLFKRVIKTPSNRYKQY